MAKKITFVGGVSRKESVALWYRLPSSAHRASGQARLSVYRYGRPSLPALQVVTDDPRRKLSRSVGVNVLGDPCSPLLIG